MLMYTALALSWALLGAVAAAAHDGALPVYLVNVAAPFAGLTVFDSDAAPAVLSHFRGDGIAAYSDNAERVLRLIPSTFMDERNTAVVLMDGFDVAVAEPRLGSPHFYLGADSAASITAGAKPGDVADLVRIDSALHPVLRVDPAEQGYSIDEALAALGRARLSKVMLIGLPEQGSAHGTEKGTEKGADMTWARKGRAEFARAATNHTAYTDIPAFFESEDDCVAITGDCSGRGSCVKSSNGMYACRCQATQRDGRTTRWGGNDCSKRDVSAAANLLVWTTVAIVVAGTLSIGLLFNLGSEPLPGILTTAGL